MCMVMFNNKMEHVDMSFMFTMQLFGKFDEAVFSKHYMDVCAMKYRDFLVVFGILCLLPMQINV